ncbi:MAG TPA: magnesium transporter CorA family protein [Sunxiuqinia sp.]|nr:magnesium transporter CorA family protein [Sunxiuqinia sp.]
MLKIFKSFGGYVEIPQAQKGCWINVVQPSKDEIEQLQTEFNMPPDIIQDILDIDERPRYEFDDDWSLIILRIPVDNPANGVPYYTLPLGIFMINNVTITLCSTINEVLTFEQPTLYRSGQTLPVHDELNFIIKLFLRSGSTYLRYLKQINQQTGQIEQELEKSIRNEELNKLLKMEKCLVYFITSLKANEIVLAKLRNSLKRSITEVNEDLLEDAIIENKQALEMSQIYSDIQSGMMDAFASVISNNLNVVMKQLASISIILMIPTLIASLYGMNVPNSLEQNDWAFAIIIIISAFLSLVGIIIFRKKDLF